MEKSLGLETNAEVEIFKGERADLGGRISC